ncbi:MAG: flagellin [Bacillota bacterium]
MRINHNINALNAWRNLTVTDGSLAKSLERLSSGYRINKAADDAAGLAISEKMRAQIRGLQLAQRNAQNGISLIQTAEGALNETHAILQRMRELAVQALNDTNTDEDRAALDKEYQQLVNEITRIANTTEFNTTKLLDGSLGASIENVGSSLTPSNGIVSIELNGAAVANGYTITVEDGTTGKKITVSQGSVSETIDNVSVPSGFNTTTLNFASLGIKLTVNSALTNISLNNTFDVTASGSMNLQIGANATQTMAISISDMRASALGGSTKLNSTSVATASGAQTALTSIDTAIDEVSTLRAQLGAYQNRLEHTVYNLGVAAENLTAAESRIRDVDMALEMAEFTKNQILVQSGTAMLAQANMQPQAILRLLQA